MAYLAPKLAMDAKVDLSPAVVALTKSNFAAKKAGIITQLRDLTKGKLAADASLDDVTQLLDALEDVEMEEGRDTDPNTGLPMVGGRMTKDEEPSFAKGREFLKGKLSAEDMKACDDLMGYKANDAEETDEEKAKREAEEKKAKDEAEKKEKDGEPMTREAHDEAIRGAVAAAVKQANENQKKVRAAERAVRPYVGDLVIAADTADDVYRAALTNLGVKLDGVHPSAFPALLDAQPKPGAKPRIAQDSRPSNSTADDYSKAWPGAARIAHQ
jgi:hypothetical protein